MYFQFHIYFYSVLEDHLPKFIARTQLRISQIATNSISFVHPSLQEKSVLRLVVYVIQVTRTLFIPRNGHLMSKIPVMATIAVNQCLRSVFGVGRGTFVGEN